MRTPLHLIALFAVTIMTSGCNPPDTLTQISVPTLPLANVTCNELSFYLDPSLGSDCKCETVPENSTSDIPMDIFIYPTHTELTIQNYPLTHTQAEPMIIIYPVDRFSELLPDVLPRHVSDLESFISDGALSGLLLPFLPPQPLTQAFFSQETVLSFNGGQGIRYITQYNEFDNVITNRTIFYTYQGLTDDGMYWVTITLPISNPILLPDDYIPWPPEGYTDESWSKNYDSYVSEVKDALDAQAPGSFSPTLNILDNLVYSISVR